MVTDRPTADNGGENFGHDTRAAIVMLQIASAAAPPSP